MCEPESEKIHLAKIYLKSKFRGKGWGILMIERAKEIAAQNGLKSIYLNVNKNNTKSIEFYEKCGFVKTREGVFDIGNGFVMDDYIFEFSL